MWTVLSSSQFTFTSSKPNVTILTLHKFKWRQVLPDKETVISHRQSKHKLALVLWRKNLKEKKNRYSHGGFKKGALLETARDEKNGSIILEILSLFSSLYYTSEFLIYFLSWNRYLNSIILSYAINFIEKGLIKGSNIMNSLGTY